MAYNNTTRKTNPSFPSNYVTLVQLQQRWLQDKERKKRDQEQEEEEDRRQKEKQFEDEASEAPRVEPDSASASQWWTRTNESYEPSAPEMELAGDGGGDDLGEDSKKAKSKKKKKGQRQRGFGSMAESEVGEKEQRLLNVEKDCDGGSTSGENWVENGGLDRTVGVESDSRVSSGNRGVWKKRHGYMKSDKGRRVEIRKTDGEATAVSDIIESRPLFVNLVTTNEDVGSLRRNGDGDREIERIPVRGSWEKCGDRGEARPESNGLDRSVNVESQIRALNVRKNGGFNSGKGKIRSEETRAKLEPEISSSLDQLVDVDSQSKALSVNAETVEKNKGRERSRKSNRKSGGTYAKIEPELMAESSGLDQLIDFDLQSKALSANVETVKKSKGHSWSRKSETKRGETRAKIENELMLESSGLDQLINVDSQSKYLSVNGCTEKKNKGHERSGKHYRKSGEAWAKIEPELMAESSGLDQLTGVDSQSKGLSVNGETVKRNKGHERSRKSNRRSGKTRAKIEPELMAASSGLDQFIDVESQSKAFSLNGETVTNKGHERSGKSETKIGGTRGKLEPELMAESKPLSANGETVKENNGHKRSGKSIRKISETCAKSDTLDQVVEIESELEALPVNVVAGVGNEELRMSVKQQDGSLRRNRENDIRPTRNGFHSKVRDLHINGRSRKDNAGLKVKYVPVSRNEESEGGSVEKQTDQKADIEPEFMALSVTVTETIEGNGAEAESQEIRVETVSEDDSLNQTNNIKSVAETSRLWERTRKGNVRRIRRSAYHNRGVERESGLVWVKKGDA